MATYIVKNGQNLFDIALDCYGSIEGLFDLLITNDALSTTSDVYPGQKLQFHEGFLTNSSIYQSLHDSGIMPANGERHVYHKDPKGCLKLLFYIDEEASYTTFKASGDGHMIIDWGDNSDLEEIELSIEEKEYTHNFDNNVDKRAVRIYERSQTPFSFITLDTSDANGQLYVIRECIVDEYTSKTNSISLLPLFLFKNTYKVDLQYCDIENLIPLVSLELQELDLRYVSFPSVSVIDDYLTALVDNYGTRRACKVYLSTEPTAVGMEAIYTILNESDWNTDSEWEFIINGTTVTV